MTADKQRIGSALVILSSALFGLSGIFTKWIAADTWTILTWRGLFGGLLICAYVLIKAKDARAHCMRLGWGGWMLALVGSLSSITFIAAFKLTYVANVTVIYALVPFAAAILEWLVLHERIQWQTMFAALVSTVGVIVLVSGTLGAGSELGNVLAIVMMLLNAAYAVLIRLFKDANVVLAGGVASLQLFCVGWLIGKPLDISGADLVLTVIFGLSFGAASILWTEGARLIPAAEVGVLSTGDVPIAIFFAWALLAEVPPAQGMAGGAIVLASVVAYSLWKARASSDRVGSH